MAHRLRCPRCGSHKYWIIRGDKRRCAKCRYEWRPSRLPLRLSPLQWRRLLGWFVKGVRSGVIAQETGLYRQRVYRALTVVRKIIAAEISPGLKEGWQSSDEKKQVPRLTGFSGYLRRQLGGRGGIRRDRWPLYLAEYMWRYNARELPQEQQVRELMRLLREKGSIGG